MMRPIYGSRRTDTTCRTVAGASPPDREVVQTGVATGYADLARLGHVTRARVTQIMNLLILAPDLQETISCWPPIMSGKDPISERRTRVVVAELEWKKAAGIVDSDRCEVQQPNAESDG